jgi:hypothetical protein
LFAGADAAAADGGEEWDDELKEAMLASAAGATATAEAISGLVSALILVAPQMRIGCLMQQTYSSSRRYWKQQQLPAGSHTPQQCSSSSSSNVTRSAPSSSSSGSMILV